MSDEKLEPSVISTVKTFKLVFIRTLILSVIIVVINNLYVVYHSYDFRPNWTPLSAITIINHKNYNFLDCDRFKKLLLTTNSLVKLLLDSLLSDILL